MPSCEAIPNWTGIRSLCLNINTTKEHKKKYPFVFFQPKHPPITHRAPPWRLTGRILVDDGDRLPLVELHDVQHGPADGGVLGVEVDVEAVLVVHRRVFPARLDVRDLQGVADGLHRADRGAVGGAEHGADAQGQLVARWARRRQEGGRQDGK